MICREKMLGFLQKRLKLNQLLPDEDNYFIFLTLNADWEVGGK
jgi:hypothetical protein